MSKILFIFICLLSHILSINYLSLYNYEVDDCSNIIFDSDELPFSFTGLGEHNKNSIAMQSDYNILYQDDGTCKYNGQYKDNTQQAYHYYYKKYYQYNYGKYLNFEFISHAVQF